MITNYLLQVYCCRIVIGFRLIAQLSISEIILKYMVLTLQPRHLCCSKYWKIFYKINFKIRKFFRYNNASNWCGENDWHVVSKGIDIHAVGAMGVLFPLITVYFGFSQLIAIGTASYISRMLGLSLATATFALILS